MTKTCVSGTACGRRPARYRRTPRAFLVPVLTLATAGVVQAQVVPAPPPGIDSVSVTPAALCRASSFFASLAGSGHRDLWTTPITVPVADLGTLSGGEITELWLGGGRTTQTLHARVASGRRYVFRSVQKNSRQSLAEEFWGTPVEAIVQDQLCSLHPTGAVAMPVLMEAVGVLHTEPRFLVLPDDPRLGEFREQFAGMLVLFEERPDVPASGGPGFAGSLQVEDFLDLVEILEDDPVNRVERSELLRARLIDTLVGDRDRSHNNHLWARIDLADGSHLWRPIPRDRDQVFVRFDGAVKALGRYYDPRFVSFGDEYPDIEGLTRHAWDIDRNFLVGLEREEWDGIVRGVQATITDDLIAEAVRRIPPEHYSISGPAIEASLRIRRDRLLEAAEEMYQIVFRYADVHVTDEDEVATIDGLGEGRVRVAVHRRAAPDGPSHFERTFLPGETREIRLYMHGGDDLVRVEGNADSRIRLRIIGGGGADELINASGRGRVLFYDAGDRMRISGENAKLVRRSASRIYSWLDGPGERDWGSFNLPMPVLSFDKDRGMVLGLALTHDRYGFLRQPFSSRLQASFGWSAGRSQPIVHARQYLQDRIGRGDIRLRGSYSGVEVLRFYGLGNETEESEPPAFYEVRQKQLLLGADLSFGDGLRRRVSVGPVFRYTSSDTSDAATFIADERPYGTGTFSQAGLQVSVSLDGTDIPVAAERGYRLEGTASWYPELLDVASSFGEIHGEAAVYASPGSGNPVLALRAGGKKIWGTFPYSDAAFLGGARDVRGYREQRYAGDASLYGNAELRVFLARFVLIAPIDFGVLGFADAGRVFVDGESSDTWHGSWGGGTWFGPANRLAIVHASLARGAERTTFYLGLGFAF